MARLARGSRSSLAKAHAKTSANFPNIMPTFDNLVELLDDRVRTIRQSSLQNLTIKSKNSSQHNQAKKAHKNGYEIAASASAATVLLAIAFPKNVENDRIKKPKTFRYPSLKGTDPKFRRNHKHALHGTMKALKEVREGKRDAA
ncbi:60S ribosomal protein L29 [Fonsecaea erecta]|uniref:60S ribosomal protein L29 n=1 Tax=Fonsecaea erecta TaxID=1367422 RepID=A0A178ZWZ5_9EURO|nr:60S ribosomal protein L29 [Fonsecaea erecta]OAP63803.1 60S ribosomal protein L29 [Fonsecaea erecta]